MGMKANIAMLIIWIITIVIGVGASITHYNDVTYQADQGKEWLWRARATNDLNDMARYLQEAENKLGQFHGNPSWWFPKPDTDYDLINTNIKEVIHNAQSFNATNQSSFSYQQAVQNLQETIVEIVSHVDGANWWLQNPVELIIIYTLWTWLWAIFLLIAMVTSD
jgi:hypothetical protein